MRAISHHLPMFRRCCVAVRHQRVPVQQCRLASTSVIIRNVGEIEDALVKQFAERAAKVVAFRRMYKANGEPTRSCLAGYATETEGKKAINTLNGQKIKNDQAKAVVVEETRFNPAKVEVEECKWGSTETQPGTEGRSVIVAHKPYVESDKVRKHIEGVIGGETSITAFKSCYKGMSFVLFD
eukprot:Filipodium_phascolosomae@DN2736_c0_g1_i11.p1